MTVETVADRDDAAGLAHERTSLVVGLPNKWLLQSFRFIGDWGDDALFDAYWTCRRHHPLIVREAI